MRAYSTPESVAKGEITWLAIAECVVSATIYLGIGFYRGSFAHLAWAVAVAPLMLFRTERSAEWGLALYARWFKWVLDLARKSDAVAASSFVLLSPVVGLAIRVLGTVHWTLRTPLQTLTGAPEDLDWQALCHDFIYPPEILPGEARVEFPLTFAFIVERFHHSQGLVKR